MICCSGFIPPQAGSRNCRWRRRRCFSPSTCWRRRKTRSSPHAPLHKRRPALEAFAKTQFKSDPTFRLSPATASYATAQKWLEQSGGGSDGVIAKRIDLPYQAGNRDGMQKIKKFRSADCVIGGFRYATNKSEGRKVVGSLLLGLYDDEGLLHHVGFTSAIKQADKPALTQSSNL